MIPTSSDPFDQVSFYSGKVITPVPVMLLDAAELVGLHLLMSLEKLRKAALRKSENTPDLFKRKGGISQQVADYLAQILINPVVRTHARHAADSPIKMARVDAQCPGIERYRVFTMLANQVGKKVHVTVAARLVFERYGQYSVAFRSSDVCQAAVNHLWRNGRVFNRNHRLALGCFKDKLGQFLMKINQFLKSLCLHLRKSYKDIKNVPLDFMNLCEFIENSGVHFRKVIKILKSTAVDFRKYTKSIKINFIFHQTIT